MFKLDVSKFTSLRLHELKGSGADPTYTDLECNVTCSRNIIIIFLVNTVSLYLIIFDSLIFFLSIEMVRCPMTASRAFITSVCSRYNVNSQIVVTRLNGLMLTHGRFI